MHLRLLASLVVVALFALMGAAPPAEPTYVRANVHALDWNVMTAAAVSLDALHTNAGIDMTVTAPAEVAALWALVDVKKMKPAAKPGPVTTGDFRLLIEFVAKDGTKDLYAARLGTDLVRISDGASRKIDDAFKQHFTFQKPLR